MQESERQPLSRIQQVPLYGIFYGLAYGLVWYVCRNTYLSYDWLEARLLAGLTTMFSLALGLSVLVAPGFVSGMVTRKEDKPTSVGEWLKLHSSVIGITLVALSVVFLGLWIVGWIIEWIKFGGYLLKRWLLGS